MATGNKELLNRILESVAKVEYVKTEDIPNIDLYMDQVTTFMDDRLRKTSRYPEQDKIMTKTMINNYAKNDLLPPPSKKKYSKEHILILIFIYYYKGFLSIGDIQTLLKPLTEKYFHTENALNIEEIYEEVFSLEQEQIEVMKKDVMQKYECAERTFENAPDEEREFLKKFSFICMLSFDVYVKKMIIEKLIDEMKESKK